MIGILFDLDGTLLNTLDDLRSAVNHTMNVFGYPEHTREEVRRFVGNGAARLLQLAVPAGEDWQAPLAEFQCYYREHCQEATAPYPGISAALEALSAHPIAVVSDKPDAATKRLCAQYFPGVYVGDSEVDVLTAANAGVPCLSVLWGFRDKAEIQAVGGSHFCESPAQMPAILEKMIKELKENGQ